MRISRLPYHMPWESGPIDHNEYEREAAKEELFEERAYDIDAMVEALRQTNQGGLFRSLCALCDSDRAAVDRVIRESISENAIDNRLRMQMELDADLDYF